MDVLSTLNAKRILLVEERHEVVDRVADLLRRAGYEVENAYNAGDALAARHDRFAATLLNVAMRDRDGKSILELIRDHPSFSQMPLLPLNDLLHIEATRGRSEANTMLINRLSQLLGKKREGNVQQILSMLNAAMQAQAAAQPAQPVNSTSTTTASSNGLAQSATGQPVKPASSAIPTPATSPIPQTAPSDSRETQEIEIDPDNVPTQRSRAVLDSQLQRRLDAFKTLSNLVRSISSVLDLNQVLNQIVEAAATLCGAEEGLLLLPDEEDKALYLRARKGIDDDSAHNFRIRSDEALVGRVYRTGEPVLEGGRDPLKLKTEFFVKSLLYVPMNYKGKTIGVLGVNNRGSGRVFTPLDQEILLDLAAQAAIAIENARLYEERLLQNKRLTTLYEAGQSVNSTLALSHVLLTISRQIIKALDVNACLVKQRDPESAEKQRQSAAIGKQTAILTENELIALAHTWQSAWRVEQGPKVSLEERPMLKQALTQSAAYVVSRSQGGTRLMSDLHMLQIVGADHLVVLPIRVGNQSSFGVVELFYRGDIPDEVKSEPWARDLRARVRSIAVEIYARVKPRRDGPPPPEVYSMAQQILDITGAKWLIMSVLPSDTQNPSQLARVLHYGEAVFLETPKPDEVILPPQIQPVFQEGKAVAFHMRQPNLAEPVRELMAGFGAEALLCLPLVVKGTVFGTFIIYSTSEARFFRPDEIELASALMVQAATAIENARLYRDLQRSVDDLKQAQAGLVQAARLSTMGELAAVVAHQINNPLTTIMADSEIMLADMTPEHPNWEALQAIHRSGQRAHAVVKRLLSTARRGGEETPQWVDVHSTIQHTLDLVTAHIERGKIKFGVDLDQSVPSYILAPPGQLEDVWLNLLLNARDALRNTPNATLGIISRRSALFLNVMVSDNGPGIPSDVQPKVFEPFFTTKPHGEGTGLGLYICRRVIEQCAGKLTVDSAIGQGTLFRISLPVSETPY